MAKLTISYGLYEQVNKHLLNDDFEHLAFFLCSVSRAAGSPVLIAREVILVKDAELDGPPDLYCLQLRLEPLLTIVNTAIRLKMALVEAHSHPFSNFASFSPSDRAGFREFVPYIIDSLKGLPYCATVWGKLGISGAAWQAWPKEEPLEITVAGEKLLKPSAAPSSLDKEIERYDRQIRAFGKDAQEKLRKLRIGIVGLGGIGSHVAQQLAYLGARDFILVDDQVVEKPNLNRLIGATLKDIRKSKVEVISACIKRIAPEARMTLIPENLRTVAALDALKVSDIIFGCVDNDGARLILNELSLAYLVPLIDCGVEIHVEDGLLEQAGGRVNLVLPNGACLHCMDQIDLEEARISLASPHELRQARQLGYIRGDPEPSPSVVMLNGVIASAAVTEFLNLIIGLRPPCSFLTYDMLGKGRGGNAQWLVPQKGQKAEGCFECSLSGIGDEVRLDRYLITAKTVQRLRKEE